MLNFYKKLSAFVKVVPKHNVLVIRGDFNERIIKIYTNKRTTYHELPIEMLVIFMNLLLKMNYTFVKPNYKISWVNYGLSGTLMALKPN